MITIQGLDHLVLRVRDLSVALHFYVDLLGCTVERRQDEIGLVQLRAGAQLIDLVTLDGKLGRMGGEGPGAEGRNMDHFCLRVTTLDEPALRGWLVSQGVLVDTYGSRYGAEGEGPSLYLFDPDGNTLELKGPPWPTGQPIQPPSSVQQPPQAQQQHQQHQQDQPPAMRGEA
jgi:catechol 2,3-dioxygenase-like lactoylglutathione lyase family enzyme